ncbi:MAG: hypothetical protein A2Y10_11870 [Planctomycetes bacterium GWF2_41_51]|nr:MAG: hypothetical protein A2Y10_11870 [Planctomycetes bacterium GWF2_41_51]HBG28643.1 hypothetical protein [Phycisphaerales bacterium]
MINNNYKHIISLWFIFSILLISGCFNRCQLSKSEQELHEKSLNMKDPKRWENTIQQLTQMDYNNPPPEDAVLFVGSSTVVRWDTDKWFQGINTINHGFGGSFIADSVYYADRIIVPYKPATIVFYAGDNDIAHGKSPEMLIVDFKAFVLAIREELPHTKIIFISIKPSIKRWDIWPQMERANKLIKKICQKQPNLYFVDVSTVMLDKSGTPRKDIFIDGLHMNEAGYQLWTSLLKPIIK